MQSFNLKTINYDQSNERSKSDHHNADSKEGVQVLELVGSMLQPPVGDAHEPSETAPGNPHQYSVNVVVPVFAGDENNLLDTLTCFRKFDIETAVGVMFILIHW